MTDSLVGSWKLKVWRRITDDKIITFPLGEQATGLLNYTPEGSMLVQLVAAGRPQIDTSDPLQGGTCEQRAAAYATCLAYFGRYELQGDEVIHRVDGSLFPDWSGQEQIRPYTLIGDTLTLHTPPTHLASGEVTNELVWTRIKP